jgi:hypothetical protein
MVVVVLMMKMISAAVTTIMKTIPTISITAATAMTSAK